MEEKKKLVLPGDYVSSAEEAVPGQNTYEQEDNIYSAAVGVEDIHEGTASVKVKQHGLVAPKPGMHVYGLVFRTSLNKAICNCVPVDEVEGKIRTMEFEGVLPVTEIRRGFVKDIRDEVKIGDIIKVKIKKIDRTGVELSMLFPEYGLVAVHCPRCRTKMDLKDNIFICGQCSWKERRKIPSEGGRRNDYGSQGRNEREERS
jgi:exosome complex component CSL4